MTGKWTIWTSTEFLKTVKSSVKRVKRQTTDWGTVIQTKFQNKSWNFYFNKTSEFDYIKNSQNWKVENQRIKVGK